MPLARPLIALIAALHLLASKEFEYLSASYGTMLQLQPMPWTSATGVLGAGTALGFTAAWLCAARAARARQLQR